MMWRNVERLIARLNRDRRSLLKAHGTWRDLIRWGIIFKMIKSQPLIKGVITDEIKTDGNTSEMFDQDSTMSV